MLGKDIKKHKLSFRAKRRISRTFTHYATEILRRFAPLNDKTDYFHKNSLINPKLFVYLQVELEIIIKTS